MNTKTDAVQPNAIGASEPTQQRLQAAFLVRCLSDGRTQQFILEDVATRKRQRFDDLAALQAWLQNRFTDDPG